MLARYFMPVEYGNYQYITVIITSILVLSNLGTEKAYFTFISQKPRPLKFHIVYYAWQVIQLCILLLIFSIIEKEWLALVFHDVEARLVLIGLIALFLSGSIQTTLGNIFESVRETKYIQMLSIGIACLHLVLIFFFIRQDELTITLLFQVIAFEYIVYLITAINIIKRKRISFTIVEEFNFKSSCLEFYHYSKPLVLFILTVFLYTFFDRWLIQTYIGSEGQAFFSIAIQFSTLTAIIYSSILKIFWKEVSEAINNKDMEKVKKYFVHVSSNVFIFTTVLATTLFFFSHDIITHLYGTAYRESLIVFQLIMLYTIPQSLGQLHATYFIATSQTKVYTTVSLIFMLISFPIAFLLVSDMGFQFNEAGIAAKMLILGLVGSIVSEYLISRHLNISMRLFNKLLIIVAVGFGTYLMYTFANIVSDNIFVQALTTAFLYILPVSYYLFQRMKIL